MLNFSDRYASEVDVDFVRRSIKAIGQTAVKIESGAERCVNVLLDLISTRVSYVVQEAVVVMKVSYGANTIFSLAYWCAVGYLQEIPANVRGGDSNVVCEPRRTR